MPLTPDDRAHGGADDDSSAPATMDPPRGMRRIPLAPHQMLEPITSQRDLFVLAHLGIPRIDVDRWKLEIGGLVGRSASFTFDDIRRLPKKEIHAFHQCAGNPANPKVPTRRVANVVWGGVDLKSLLDTLGISPAARFLWSFGADHGEFEGLRLDSYVKDFPLEELARRDVLLAYEVNGEPLEAEHGFPLRLVVPGFYGTNSVKWLTRLQLADRRADGLFTTRFYNDPAPVSADNPEGRRPVWQVAPESVIVSPEPDARLGSGAVTIWGWAWADGGVASVEISTDGGQNWRAAQLDRQTGRSWQKFRAAWEVDGIGGTVLMSRAADTRGAVQPASDWRNAVHGVRVTKVGRA